jgi:uncharacterized protein YkwD
MPTEFNRRSFLKQATVSALALPLSTVARNHWSVTSVSDTDTLAARNDLLNIVNYERRLAGVSILKLDELACNIADKHAIEMAENNFLSHWSLDGRKPYHRYSLGGGTEATAENDGASDHSAPIASDEIQANLTVMHKSMHAELPPNDGHRKTILAPHHTHVGFGIANRGLHLRLCEIYVARYVSIDPYSVIKQPRSQFLFSGQLLDLKYSVQGIDVFYESLPSPPERSWLKTPRPYSLPEERDSLLPKLPENTFYEDGSKGSIEIASRGRFRVPITLTRKQPGIYTIVAWIQRNESEQPFPATQVCLRAE